MDIAGPLQSCVHLADARGGSAMDRTRPALASAISALREHRPLYPLRFRCSSFVFHPAGETTPAYYPYYKRRYRFGLARFVPSIRESFDRFDSDFSLNEVFVDSAETIKDLGTRRIEGSRCVPFRQSSIVKQTIRIVMERFGDREQKEQRERKRERERDCLYVFSLWNNDVIADIAADGISSANLHNARIQNRWCFSCWRKVIYAQKTRF